MKQILSCLLLLCSFSAFSQIRGKITDDSGIPLPMVSVLIENTYNGTSSNEAGDFELNVKTPGKYVIIFQSLGFKTKKITVNADKFPFTQNVKLSDENLALNEVVINTKDNPANAIIRSAIAARKENSDRTGRFTADFYSRGIFRAKDIPKTIMGQKVGDLDGILDSTRSGVLYLSETVSKISFEKPDKLKERIIASKVSGHDNGFSYNTALATSYDFYDNTVELGAKMISPIADNAFAYYKYKMEGTFNDASGNTINKIKLTARRDNEPVFDGYIYIVDDSWAIYAVELETTGARMKQEMLSTMKLVQNFSFNQNENLWSKNTQSLEFTAGFLMMKFTGKFSYVYSNYEFKKEFEKKTFGNEIVSFEDNSNKKDDNYWSQNRPIPLTTEEIRDYIRKDSIRTLRESRPYLDSIDKKNNKFHLGDVLFGYSYQNSYKKYSFGYRGLEPSSMSFNTVQGWNLSSGLWYRNRKEEKGVYTNITADVNYGFADQRARFTGSYYHRFNNQTYDFLSITGGTAAVQYNPSNPIGKVINTVSTLFFKDNYMKLYNKEFAGITYGRDVANGLNLSGRIEYQQRKPLVNTTDQSVIKNDDPYTSNNPLDPTNDAPAFSTHHITKAGLAARFVFGNKYMSRPDGKINYGNDKSPTLFLNYTNAFAGSEKNYEYQFASARLTYGFDLGNKGDIELNVQAGKFFDAEGISFIDYKHFNGNQTHVGTAENYLNVFNLLPYYSASTNNSFSENHIEYNDRGFVMNKLPLLKLLKSNLALGFHSLAIPDRKPYLEYTVGLDHLGFGKFHMLRVDYVRAYQGSGFVTDGVIFGLKFLDFLGE